MKNQETIMAELKRERIEKNSVRQMLGEILLRQKSCKQSARNEVSFFIGILEQYSSCNLKKIHLK